VLYGFDVDEGSSLCIEGISGPGYGADPPPEGRVLGDVGQGSKPDAHLVQAKGVHSWQTNTSDAQFCAQRTLRKVTPQP
jgi:hypothetical protein